jgi:hypothetical protein
MRRLVVLVMLAAVACACAGCGGGPTAAPVGPAPEARVAVFDKQLRDAPQDGITLGGADAPWTLTIYASMTEPDAGLLFKDVPSIVRRWVLPGELKVQVRTLSLGEEATVDGDAQASAARLMQAAGLQDRFWSAWALLTARHAGFATADDVRAAIADTAGTDLSRIDADARSSRVRTAVRRADELARTVVDSQAPSYTLTRGEGRPVTIAGDCVACLVPEIKNTIARAEGR